MEKLLPERAMNAMEAGIRTARKNPPKEGDPMADDYVAWCIWNALRLAGLKIVDAESPNND